MTVVKEIAVRMGEIGVSATPGEVLISIGLGSCIGLAVVDQRRGIAGLAHIMLPEALAPDGQPGKFADLAVPALIERTVALGTARGTLKAIIVGGAQMFSLNGGSGTLDIGVRNEAAVRGLLAGERIPIVGAATRGSKGRSIKVWPGGAVVGKEAGGPEVELLPGAHA
jgi:chemotaxis protein CheD